MARAKQPREPISDTLKEATTGGGRCCRGSCRSNGLWRHHPEQIGHGANDLSGDGQNELLFDQGGRDFRRHSAKQSNRAIGEIAEHAFPGIGGAGKPFHQEAGDIGRQGLRLIADVTEITGLLS